MLLVALLAVVLIGAWLLALRAQLRRTDAHSVEWTGAHHRPELWTSAARCGACGRRAGVLDEDGDVLWFVCLHCGTRTRRINRG